MRTVTYKVDDLKKVAIHIGRAEENEATRVQIDAGSVFAEYPAAVPAMKVISPAGVTYSREVTRDGDLVVWDVVDSDLAAEGYGEMQLTFTENSVKVKSAIAQIRVCRSISGGTTPPDPVQDWLDEAEDALEAFPTGGTTGQVLAKKSNDDYDTEWVDQGSGGTTDYTDLTNKPQIGGVTLNGNKSLSDLGAASASDVSAKYTKPSGGIPATDIAAGVIPDPEDVIDDTAGEGDTDKTWSANKLTSDVLSALQDAEEDIAELDGDINGQYVQSINLFNPNDPDILTNKYIDQYGEEQTMNNYYEFGFIACSPGDTFTFYNSDGYVSSTRVVAFYDANKQFVSGDNKVSMPTMTIPTGNIAYFRSGETKLRLNNKNYMIVKNNTEIQPYVPYGMIRTGGMKSDVYPWDGKSVVLFGDSIMWHDGHDGIIGYPTYIKELGFSMVTNKGVSGACVAYHSERQYEDIVDTVDTVTFTNYDLCVIAGGVNDFIVSSATPIGTLTDSVTATDFDKTTFIGALQYIVTKILTGKSTIKIAFMTPLKKTNWNTANSQGKVLKDYVDAIKEVAEYYSIPVIDMYSISGLNNMNMTDFLYDGLHPNNEGYLFFSKNKLTSFINDL